MAYVADLQRDFDRFKGDFDLVGKHLGNAHTKYVEAEKRLDRFEGKLERASEQDTVELEDEPAEYQPALDAA
jgi:DNA recombination protein RmuC